MRIQVADPIDPAGIQILRARAEVIEASSLTDIGNVDALIVRGRTEVRAADLERGRASLKIVGRAGVGVDNVDLESCRSHGIVVVNAPLAASNAVAEHAIGLMFALARQTPRADALMKEGQWPKKQLRGMELEGKTLGIIGMGRIGASVAHKATALGMTILAHDPPLPAEEIQERGARPASLEELLARSHYISLHVPLAEATRGLIGRAQLSQAQSGLRIVSTARGGVLDESALLEALQSGKVAGAALDVFENEPPGGSPLVQQPNVIATPHIGAQTAEAQRRVAVQIAEEVLAGLDGEELRWRVV